VAIRRWCFSTVLLFWLISVFAVVGDSLGRADAVAPCVYTLSLEGSEGSVIVDSTEHALPWSGDLPCDAVVYVEAVPGPDPCQEFAFWSGDVVGTSNPIYLLMDSSKTAEVHFEAREQLLSVDGSGDGAIEVDGTSHALPWAGAVDCGSTVTVWARPDAGWQFVGWTGDLTTATNPLLLDVDGDVALTASFVPSVWGEGTEVHLAHIDSEGHTHPAISGNHVVWYEVHDGPPNQHIITLFDLSTWSQTDLLTSVTDILCDPDISGNWVVWTQTPWDDPMPLDWQVIAYDLGSGTATPVATTQLATLHHEHDEPVVSGDYLVWVEQPDPGEERWVLHLYNLATQAEIPFPASSGNQSHPSIHDGRVVWADNRDGDYDIYMFDIATGTETQVTDTSNDEMEPAIWRDSIVFVELQFNWHIRLHDLSTGETSDITTATYDVICGDPEVNGDWVTWREWESWDPWPPVAAEIFVHSLSTGETYHCDQGDGLSGFAGADVWGDRVVYDDNRAAVTESRAIDIYLWIPTTFVDVSSWGYGSESDDPYWALSEIEACVSSGVVGGFADGTYRPTCPVSRAQMAVYMSRALAGGDENVPDFAGTPTFPDVDEEHWGLDYVEYAVDESVVGGYEDGSYHPEYEVTRDQMAVYVARGLVAPEGEAGLGDYVPSDPRDFPDVPTDHWACTHIEYCVENGVASGYLDGSYHPETVVTRDQMAVYVARGFELGG